MLNNTNKVTILRGAVICIAILAGSFTSVNAQAAQDEEITPEVTVQAFYKWYLHWTNEKHDLTKNRDGMTYSLSKRFGERLYSKEGQRADHNAFVDGKDWNNAWLKNMEVGKAAITGDKAVLKLVLKVPPDPIAITLEINLVKETGEWKIDSVKRL